MDRSEVYVKREHIIRQRNTRAVIQIPSPVGSESLVLRSVEPWSFLTVIVSIRIKLCAKWDTV